MGKVYIVPAAPPDRVPTEHETILSKAKKPDYKIDHESGCWVWQGHTLQGKYGVGGKHERGTSSRAHRMYFERAFGPVPPGHDVHHTCKNTLCVNPAHLMAVQEREHDIEHFMRERGHTLDTVRAIRAAGRQPGASVIELQERFGVSHQTIKNYWNGIAWADLLGESGPVITPPVICHIAECDKPAVGNRNSRYCSAKHRNLGRDRKQKARKRALKEASRVAA